MKQRANVFFPYAIALALPPAGAVLAAAAYSNDDDRDLGVRLLITAVLGACVWGIVLAALA